MEPFHWPFSALQDGCYAWRLLNDSNNHSKALKCSSVSIENLWADPMPSFYREAHGGLKCVETCSGSCRLASEQVLDPDPLIPQPELFPTFPYTVSHENRDSYLLFCHSMESIKGRHLTAQAENGSFRTSQSLKTYENKKTQNAHYSLKTPKMDIRRCYATFSGL